MLRRRQINADPGGRAKRALLGAAEPARWPFERFYWMLERLYWALEDRLLWRLQERAGSWEPPGRVAGAGALAAVAVAAVLVGVLWLSSDEAPRERAAAPAKVAIVPPPQPQVEREREPALQGVPPSFGVDEGVGVARTGGAGPKREVSVGGVDDDGAETGETGDFPAEASASAGASARKPVPAGPAAMKVARRFSEAFVFYEIGEREERAKTVFGETATPRLAEALGERPPRQPESTEVPQARVVNLVPGPRAGKAYTVSVSLLRVGLTSELRLELRKKQGEWRVTDVRG